MILHGIEYQRPTSLNMRILADHVTYSFLAFMKSIFHFCLGCYCGGYSQNGRSNLSSKTCLPKIHVVVESCTALTKPKQVATQNCHRMCSRSKSGLLFSIRQYVLPNDITKSPDLKICAKCCLIAPKFNRRIDSSAAIHTIISTFLTARYFFQIWWRDVVRFC